MCTVHMVHGSLFQGINIYCVDILNLRCKSAGDKLNSGSAALNVSDVLLLPVSHPFQDTK